MCMYNIYIYVYVCIHIYIYILCKENWITRIVNQPRQIVTHTTRHTKVMGSPDRLFVLFLSSGAHPQEDLVQHTGKGPQAIVKVSLYLG